MSRKYIGTWRITWMEQWDQEYVDMLGEGFIKLSKDGLGEFRFGVVQGNIDWKVEKIGEKELVGFSWDGMAEYDQMSGRGWAELEGEDLSGRIYIHQGDDSAFKAKRKAKS